MKVYLRDHMIGLSQEAGQRLEEEESLQKTFLF